MERSFSPRILVSAGTPEAENYENALRAAGGIPVVRRYPPADTGYDGLVLCGGGDVAPGLYGQENRGSQPPDPLRDESELALVRAWLDAGKPILGICRGAQVLNVALEGTLIQDLPAPLLPFHVWEERDKVHPVHSLPGSLLHRLYGPLFSVNSAHHQAADRPGRGLAVTARSEGGVAEALELPGRPVLGVQFHPERMTGARLRADTVDGAAIFQWFLDQCRG